MTCIERAIHHTTVSIAPSAIAGVHSLRKCVSKALRLSVRQGGSTLTTNQAWGRVKARVADHIPGQASLASPVDAISASPILCGMINTHNDDLNSRTGNCVQASVDSDQVSNRPNKACAGKVI